MVYKIGNRIRITREASGIKQKEFADQLGVSQSKVSNWESGLNRPNADQLADITRILKADANFLLGISDTPFLQAASTPLGDISDLSPETLEDINDYIEMKRSKHHKLHE